MIEPISIPAPDSTFEDRGDVLCVSRNAQSTLEFRVDGGLAFVRVLPPAKQQTPGRQMTPAGGTSTSPSRQWQQAPASLVLDLFAADSPVATFLRRHRIDILRLLLLDVAAPDAERQEES